MRDRDALEHNPHITRSALEAIHSQLFGWALSRCDFDRVVAEDLMQQAYVELLSGRARFDGRSSLKTFVFGVVHNLARSRYRRLASRLRLASRYTHGSATSFEAGDATLDRRPVWLAVQRLPARQRDIIELVFCRDLTVEQSAVVMGVTPGTARVHYDRAKRSLRASLAEFMEAAE